MGFWSLCVAKSNWFPKYIEAAPFTRWMSCVMSWVFVLIHSGPCTAGWPLRWFGLWPAILLRCYLFQQGAESLAQDHLTLMSGLGPSHHSELSHHLPFLLQPARYMYCSCGPCWVDHSGFSLLQEPVEFYIQRTMHHDIFLYWKPTRCTISQIY